MERFMDSVFQKRYSFLELLDNHHTMPQDEMIQELDITMPTLHSTAELIQSDFQSFEGEQMIRLIYHPKARSYSLEVAEDFSLLLVRLYYYDQSLRFQLLGDLLSPAKKSIHALAETHHTTYSTVSRELKYLQPQLADLGLALIIRGGVRLEGEELAIRIFYSSLYQHVYGAYKWPFAFPTQEQLTGLLEHIPVRIFRIDTLDKHVPTYFFTAISLLRAGKFNKGRAMPLYESEEVSITRQLNRVLGNYQHLISGLSEKEARMEVQLLCSILLANGSYEGIRRIPLFFINSAAMKNIDFYAQVASIVDRINFYLIRELTESEYQLLLYKLSLTFYRIQLLGPILLSQPARWNLRELKENPINGNRIKMIKYIARTEFPNFSLNYGPDYSEYLINQIYAAVFRTVDKNAYQMEINVFLFSITSTQRLENFLRNSLEGVFNLHFVIHEDAEIDLIISDSPFSMDFFPFITEEPPLIYTKNLPDIADLEKISAAFSRASFQKYCQLKGLAINEIDG